MYVSVSDAEAGISYTLAGKPNCQLADRQLQLCVCVHAQDDGDCLTNCPYFIFEE
jgi:hypothetical protein